MGLTGEISDLSLAELIEFFCNQRKTGHLKVIYPVGLGHFYLQDGSVMHATIGELCGPDAVYYALTLPNASFTFTTESEAPEQTVNQSWASVVLEGLRRVDEGIQPRDAFPDQKHALAKEIKPKEPAVSVRIHADPLSIDDRKRERPLIDFNGEAFKEIPAFLAQTENESLWSSRPWSPQAVISAIALLIVVIGVPWGWYAHSKAPKVSVEAATTSLENPEPAASTLVTDQSAAPVVAPNETNEPATNDGSTFAEKDRRDARAKPKSRKP